MILMHGIAYEGTADPGLDASLPLQDLFPQWLRTQVEGGSGLPTPTPGERRAPRAPRKENATARRRCDSNGPRDPDAREAELMVSTGRAAHIRREATRSMPTVDKLEPTFTSRPCDPKAELSNPRWSESEDLENPFRFRPVFLSVCDFCGSSERALGNMKKSPTAVATFQGTARGTFGGTGRSTASSTSVTSTWREEKGACASTGESSTQPCLARSILSPSRRRCTRPWDHLTRVCPTLHGRCRRCLCRGHDEESEACDVSSEAVTDLLRRDFEHKASSGEYTVQRFARSEWGFYPPVERALQPPKPSYLDYSGLSLESSLVALQRVRQLREELARRAGVEERRRSARIAARLDGKRN